MHCLISWIYACSKRCEADLLLTLAAYMRGSARAHGREQGRGRLKEFLMLRNLGVALPLVLVVAAAGCNGGYVSKVTTPAASGGGSPPSAPSVSPPVISPASETLRTGGQRQFSGWDSSVGQYDVTWSLQEGAAAGTITADGLYTAPGTPGNFHLIATSSHNTNLSATAPLTIVSVGFVPISTMAGRSGHTATLLLDGRVLVAGGTTDATPPSAELFIPESSSFAATHGGMVYARSDHCASLLPDGRVLIVGGGDANANLFKTAELFDPVTESFSATGNLNQARKGASATLLPNGKVLIAGGQDSGGTLLSSSELYDPSTATFTLTGNMHSPRAQHTATLLSNGKVLLVGSSSETGSAELFDPVSGLFSTTGSLIQSRAHHTATLLPSGNVLVLGGTQTMPPGGGGAAPAPVSVDSAEVYDPAKGGFQSAGKLLTARDSHTASLLANGTVLVAGGYTHGFDGDAQPAWNTIVAAELFDPASSVSTTAASLETGRAEHQATSLNDDQVLITGGVAGFQELCCSPKPHSAAVAAAELYKR
jgi:Galactose oxidase, central domain